MQGCIVSIGGRSGPLAEPIHAVVLGTTIPTGGCGRALSGGRPVHLGVGVATPTSALATVTEEGRQKREGGRPTPAHRVGVSSHSLRAHARTGCSRPASIGVIRTQRARITTGPLSTISAPTRPGGPAHGPAATVRTRKATGANKAGLGVGSSSEGATRTRLYRIVLGELSTTAAKAGPTAGSWLATPSFSGVARGTAARTRT